MFPAPTLVAAGVRLREIPYHRAARLSVLRLSADLSGRGRQGTEDHSTTGCSFTGSPTRSTTCIVVKMTRHLLGNDRMESCVAQANRGGIERVLL
jgi:hypothetical protein